MSAAWALGQQAVTLGLETLELARIHERALSDLKLSGARKQMLKRAEIFFSEAVTPIMETQRAAQRSELALNRLHETLNRRTLDLAATNRELRRGAVKRKQMEIAFAKSGKHHSHCLEESLQLQNRLRQLTHQVIEAQEDERKKISHQLHDEIAQTLLGINVRLLALKREARGSSKSLKNEIASTQRLVVKSAKSVRRFARELDIHQQAYTDRAIATL